MQFSLNEQRLRCYALSPQNCTLGKEQVADKGLLSEGLLAQSCLHNRRIQQRSGFVCLPAEALLRKLCILDHVNRPLRVPGSSSLPRVRLLGGQHGLLCVTSRHTLVTDREINSTRSLPHCRYSVTISKVIGIENKIKENETFVKH